MDKQMVWMLILMIRNQQNHTVGNLTWFIKIWNLKFYFAKSQIPEQKRNSWCCSKIRMWKWSTTSRTSLSWRHCEHAHHVRCRALRVSWVSFWNVTKWELWNCSIVIKSWNLSITKNFHFTASTFPVYTYVVHTQVGPTNLDLNTPHMLSVLSHVPNRSQSALTSVCLRRCGGCHDWGRGQWGLCSSRSS